jgi:hypothetical protein
VTGDRRQGSPGSRRCRAAAFAAPFGRKPYGATSCRARLPRHRPQPVPAVTPRCRATRAGPGRHARAECADRRAKGHSHRAGTPRIVQVGPSSVKGTRRSFLTASQKGSSGSALERRSLCLPGGPDGEARPEARPESAQRTYTVEPTTHASPCCRSTLHIMQLHFTLADLANIATVTIGLAALVLSIRTARQSNSNQRRTVLLETSNQLRSLLQEISGLLPKILADSSGATWTTEGNRLINLAEHADSLMRDVPPDSVSALDLLALAQAFFTHWHNERAAKYFKQAEEIAAKADDVMTLVTVFKMKGQMEFMLGQPELGRGSYKKALDVDQDSDTDLETDVATLVTWASMENMLQETQRRDECLSKAATLADRIASPWRHARAFTLIEQQKQGYGYTSPRGDVTTMDLALALYWTGWHARHGEFVERDACFARAEEVNPGITDALRPLILPVPDMHETAPTVVNGETPVALPDDGVAPRPD